MQLTNAENALLQNVSDELRATIEIRDNEIIGVATYCGKQEIFYNFPLDCIKNGTLSVKMYQRR